MSNKVKTIAILTAQPGKIEALTNLLHRMIPQCRAEPGNLAWDVWRDQADPAKFVLDEMYSNEAAVTAHRNTPHYRITRRRSAIWPTVPSWCWPLTRLCDLIMVR